ncbi:ATP-binding cassette sub-family C member 10-like isoform X2 [Clavelina lepadiformis]|uniref:ATP-binding cassette sub-family C member 10-like isoform X2 n=1 Tax=Clavelina lepadiformis TaxID=159417 RepID=UPI0040425029
MKSDSVMSGSPSLTRFCGTEFSIWSKLGDSFSVCFETFVFVLGPFLLLALTSSFYIGRLHPPDVNLRVPSSFNIRRICTGVTLLLTFGVFMKDVILFKLDTAGVVVLSCCVRTVALLAHFIFLWRLGMIHFDYKRGPLLVNVSWLLTLGFYGVQMERMVNLLLNNVEKKTIDVNVIIDLFCYAIMLACQLTYLVTLGRRNPRYRTVSILTNDDSNEQLEHNFATDGAERYYDISTTDLPAIVDEDECPADSAGLLSKLFFCWVQKLMRKGAKKTLLSESSVYKLPRELNTDTLCQKFSDKIHQNAEDDITESDRYVRLSREDDKSQKSKRVLLRALHRQFGRGYYLLGLLKFGGDALGFAGPILLNFLVSYVENKEPVVNGVYYATGLFASTLVGSLLITHFDYQVNKVSIAIKSSLIGAVYAKTMQAKPVAMATFSSGEITNFMSTDVNRVVNFGPSFHQFWSLPFQVIVTLVLLYEQVGIVFLAGLGLSLLMIVFNRYLAKKIGEYNQDMMKHKDSRVKLMTEVLQGIRVVKFNVWEKCLSEKISSIRNKELKSLSGIKYFDAGCVYLWATTPVLISLLIFSIYSTMGHELTAAKVFTVIALINMLIAPLNAFPWVLNGLMEAWISLDRLENFLKLPELDLDKFYDPHDQVHQSDQILDIKDGTFSWNLNVNENLNENLNETNNEDVNSESEFKDKDLLLKEISLKVKEGDFIGVVGSVGAGKSSLLSAICAGMEKLDGEIALQCASDGVAYVSQEAWIQHATVRDNILWGRPYVQDFYEAVVECCALNEDFVALPHSDMTEVGENGVTLSGGQKARLSLARAVYQDKCLYLLDDPLSAVDQHVALHLYQQCIVGILRKKTRILCTHHTKYLRHADVVIAMEEGRIKTIGTPSEVLGIDVSIDEGNFNDEDDSPPGDADEPVAEKEISISREEKATGTVAFRVYKTYWLAIGGCLALTILSFVVLMQGSKVISDWWLSQWVNANVTGPPKSSTGWLGTSEERDAQNCTHGGILQSPVILPYSSYTFLLTGHYDVTNAKENPHAKHDTAFYLEVYGGIAAANSIFTLIRAFTFAYGGICAARILHWKLLRSLLQAPVSFFDVTPVGRIINRMSSDMYTIDDSLPFMLNILLAQFAGLLATIVVTCYGLPWFAVLLLPLSAFYYYTQQYYRLTSRELKRLSSISLSPIYAHFNESLTGVSTIQAFRKTDDFKKQNRDLVERNQRCNFSTLVAQEWLAIRLQMMGVVMVTGVAFTAVLENKYSVVPPGMVGLALSYALSVTGRLSGVITSFTETEKQMVAVERQVYYINNVPQERIAPSGDLQLREEWPSRGSVEFKRVSLRYRPNLPLALNEVSFKLAPGEKVGVVGRTGSGKSSLFLTLFCMTPITGGAVYIDGININKVPLHFLRSKMVIIPQDPFLFSGSWRSNLDPEGNVGDDAIFWGAVERCGLRSSLENMGGLDADVGERGRRLSVGQRQLLCLARALLRDVQIVCLDEATANVDRASDELIQETIKKNFSGRTVLTIAHRVETVLGSDKVLVMDGGRVAEFDSPENLLSDQRSLFAQLVQKSGCQRSA